MLKTCFLLPICLDGERDKHEIERRKQSDARSGLERILLKVLRQEHGPWTEHYLVKTISRPSKVVRNDDQSALVAFDASHGYRSPGFNSVRRECDKTEGVRP